MSEGVPEGWEKRTLSEVATVIMGQSPSSSTYNSYGIGLPFFQGKTDFGNQYPIARMWCSEPTKVSPANAILFSVRAPVGDVNITKKECCIGRGLSAIIGNEVDQSFLYQQLIFSKSKFQLLSQGSTFEAVNGSEIRDFELFVPPKPEQQKIASILTSVDEVIEKTEAQITKLQDLKKGMMQELLTKGIGHTEFKDSPVGRIPREWDAVLLDSVSIRGSGHTPSKEKPEYWNGGIKWVSLADSKNLDNLYINKTDKEISEAGLANSSAVLHPKGTVILSRDAGVGKSAILGQEMAVSQHFMAWVCREKLDNLFFYYLLQHWKIKFETIAMGSTIPTIGLSYFKKLMIPLPKIEEQKRISQALLSTDKRIFALNNKFEQIKGLKKALMQDLLTGKVRVKVD